MEAGGNYLGGRDRGAAGPPARALAGCAFGQHARRQLCAWRRPAAAGGRAGGGAHLGLCPGQGLSRCREEATESACPLAGGRSARHAAEGVRRYRAGDGKAAGRGGGARLAGQRSEEHTSELQSLMRISYAVFCLKKKKII